jgi:hypothetical protein
MSICLPNSGCLLLSAVGLNPTIAGIHLTNPDSTNRLRQMSNRGQFLKISLLMMQHYEHIFVGAGLANQF